MSGGRGILGLLLIVVGIAGAYGVLSGKFPASTPLLSPTITTSGGGTSVSPSTNAARNQGNAGVIASGGRPAGGPTDLAASRGGF